MAAFLHSLLFSSIFLTSLVESFNNGGITVDLYHRDSHHLPSYDSSTTHFQRIRASFNRAFSRKSSLLASSSSSSSSSISTNSISALISSAGGEYVMKIKIGTPPVEQLGIADTGSDLTWTQCKPCTQCYKQTLPIFDPTRTSSYRRVSCESDTCSAAGTSISCGRNNSCQYQVAYGDNSYSSGDLAVETLTLEGGQSFPKVAFGCGHENEGTFAQTGSGIVGLGGGAISIINQLQDSIQGKFSYCLTLLNANASSKISFGADAVVVGSNVVSTPLVSKSPDTFYYLTLEGVSVGERRVDYAKGVRASVNEGNIIIDSGTTLTFIPSEMYEGVETELEKAIEGRRVSDPQGILKMCYEPEGFSAPSITAHFKGGDVVLPKEGAFVEVEKGVVCLTLVPSQDLAIFGNLHQMNYQVGYDLVKKEVNFLRKDCSFAD